MPKPIFICAWCMPRGIPGTHGMCKKCSVKVLAEIQADKNWPETTEFELELMQNDK